MCHYYNYQWLWPAECAARSLKVNPYIPISLKSCSIIYKSVRIFEVSTKITHFPKFSHIWTNFGSNWGKFEKSTHSYQLLANYAFLEVIDKRGSWHAIQVSVSFRHNILLTSVLSTLCLTHHVYPDIPVYNYRCKKYESLP